MDGGDRDDGGRANISYALVRTIREEIRVHDAQIEQRIASMEGRYKDCHGEFIAELAAIRKTIDDIEVMHHKDVDNMKTAQAGITAVLADWTSGARWVNRIAVTIATAIGTVAVAWEWLKNHL